MYFLPLNVANIYQSRAQVGSGGGCRSLLDCGGGGGGGESGQAPEPPYFSTTLLQCWAGFPTMPEMPATRPDEFYADQHVICHIRLLYSW